jgi:hypothetical protein
MIGGACGTHGAIIIWNTVSVEKREGNIQFERQAWIISESILKQCGVGSFDWIGLICGLL